MEIGHIKHNNLFEGSVNETDKVTSRARQNWTQSCEDSLNKQINMEYYASHYYHLLYTFFKRDNVALGNIANFFKKSSEEEREHAEKLMDYQVTRGGVVQFTGVDKIELYLNAGSKDFDYVLKSFEKALELEKSVNESLLNLHKTADENNDPQFADFLEGNYLNEQVEANYELSKYITQLEMIGNNGFGIYMFDKEFEN